MDVLQSIPWRQGARRPLGAGRLSGCEGALGQALGKTLGKGVLPDLKALQRRFALQHTPSVPEVSVNLPRASHYDALITGQGGAA